MLQKTLFNRVIYKGIMGAIFGIVAGLILGLFIFALQQVSFILYSYLIRGNFYSGPPFEFFVTLGMCFGALIGSTFGSIAALKEDTKKK